MQRSFRLATVLLASIIAVSACGSAAPKPAATSAAAVPAGPVCIQSETDARAVGFPGTGGRPLSGYIVGSGAVGVVLGDQAESTSCDWLAYARDLAQRGYRVLAFDFNGEGQSADSDGSETDDVVAAAKYLRAQPGIAGLVLIGASRGGTAALAAAAALRPPPKAVISLSAPAVYDQNDAASVVADLTMPTLLVVAKDDASFAADARSMYDKITPANRTLTIVPGGGHGLLLVRPGFDGADQATKAIDQFLGGNAPAHA